MSDLPADIAPYGPDIATEAELRLLGDVKGKRVLELGGARSSVAFANQGATAIAVDTSEARLAQARAIMEREEVRVELRRGDLADLAFLRADSVDLAFSVLALGTVEDLNRLFRQVHRVLKVGSPLIFSVVHPVWALIGAGRGPLTVTRSYFDRAPMHLDFPGAETEAQYPHTIEEIYGGLARASYRVDPILEPEPRAGGPRSPEWTDAFRFVPRTLIVRARKEGS
jgi:SAM-dependent methyltransferase